MSRAHTNTPLPIEPRPSRWLRWLLAASHGGALALLWGLPVALPLRLAVSGALALSLAFYWRRAVRLPRLLWDADGIWWRETGTAAVELRLLPDSVVSVPLVLLNFAGPDGRLTVVLLPDSLPPEVLRRLRARLRREVPRDHSPP